MNPLVLPLKFTYYRRGACCNFIYVYVHILAIIRKFVMIVIFFVTFLL